MRAAARRGDHPGLSIGMNTMRSLLPVLLLAACAPMQATHEAAPATPAGCRDGARAGTQARGAGRVSRQIAPGQPCTATPPPPAAGTAGFANDVAVSRASQTLVDTPRYALAASDADLTPAHAVHAFECALGVPITQAQAPRTLLLLKRTMVDAGLGTYGAKNHYNRMRPFVHFQEATCFPADEAALRKDGSYPSGHRRSAGLGAGAGEVAPDHTDALLRPWTRLRRKPPGVQCALAERHPAGRAIASGVVARLHADAVFRDDVAAARDEIDALRRKAPRRRRIAPAEAARHRDPDPGRAVSPTWRFGRNTARVLRVFSVVRPCRRKGSCAFACVGAIVMATSKSQSGDKIGGKPNILVIWGDDIGISNLSCYSQGLMGYRTPNIDRIASEGMLFTDSYGEQSCTGGALVLHYRPERVSHRAVEGRHSAAPDRHDDKLVTIAALLKEQGYATGQFGKNHLGDLNHMLPTNHGFDEFFGNLYHLNAEEEPEMYDYPEGSRLPRELRSARRHPFLGDRQGRPDRHAALGQGRQAEDRGHRAADKKRMETCDDEFVAAAKDFIKRQTRRQAVLRVAQHHPHAPVHAHQEGEPRQAGAGSRRTTTR
jgi:hypothetical protein